MPDRPAARLGTAVSATARFADMLEQVRLVESLGYRTVWLPETSGRDALVTAAALAEHTRTIALATGLVPVPSRSLAALAMAAATVAELAPGRFVLGLGAGHAETARHVGWAKPATVAEMEATVRGVREALRHGHLHAQGTGGPVDLMLDGIHVDVPPSLFVGALRPRMAAMAGRVADGILLNWVTVQRAEMVAAAVRKAAEGRGVSVSCYVPVCVTEDEVQQEQARAEVARQLGAYARLRAYGDLLAADGYDREVAAIRAAPGHRRTEAVDRRLLDALALIGDVAAVQTGLGRYRAVGVDEVVIAPVATGEDPTASLAATWAALAP